MNDTNEETLTDVDGKYFEIQALTKYGHNLLMKDSKHEASETFLNAYQLARKIDNAFIIRGCCFNLGACYVASGQANVGLKYLEMAIPPTQNEDGLENVSDLWYNIAVAHHSIGNIEKACVAYEKGLAGYSKLNSFKLEADCLSKLAVCYHLLGRLKDSKSAYYKAHEKFEKIGDRSNQALSLVSLTGVFSELKDIEGCAKVLDILLDVCQELEDHFLQAKIYHDIGLLYISEKLYESAAECFEQSLKSMAKENGNMDNNLKATVLQNLGAVCNYMSSYHKAIEYHQQAIDIFGEISDRPSQTQVFANLAYAYTQIKEYQNAIMAFNHAVRLAKDTGDQEAHCLSMEGLAAVYFRMGDYDKSIPSYKEAMALLPANTKNSKEYTVRSERIVSKLSDAIKFQVELQQGKIYQNQSSPKDMRKMSNSKRFFQDKQHSLIAKGLEAHSSSDENEEDESENEGDENNGFRKHQPGAGLNFSMKSTTNKYEQPADDVPRAVKEYYLAQVCQENNAKKNEEYLQEKKESSKMCAVM